MNERSFIEKDSLMSEQYLRRGEQTRSEIVHAAHDLFVQQGYHGTSMRQIASQAGIAVGGLYNHFPSKQEVFKAVFLEYHPYQEVIPALLAASNSSIEQFAHDAIHRMISALNDRPEFLNLMFIEIVEFNSLHVGELFVNLMPMITAIVQNVINVNQSELRPIPPLILMRFYFGLFFSYFITEMLFSKQAPSEFNAGAEGYFIDIFLNGVLRRDNGLANPAGPDIQPEPSQR
jgi:AcrR family transcriptional regulator